MTLYTELATVADELLAEFGQVVTFSRSTGGTYDPSTGTVSVGPTQTWSANVVVQQASKGTIESFDVRFEAGTMIETNLRSLLISGASSVAPKPGDTAVFEGATWTLIGVTPTNPAGTTLIYSATAKR